MEAAAKVGDKLEEEESEAVVQVEAESAGEVMVGVVSEVEELVAAEVVASMAVVMAVEAKAVEACKSLMTTPDSRRTRKRPNSSWAAQTRRKGACHEPRTQPSPRSMSQTTKSPRRSQSEDSCHCRRCTQKCNPSHPSRSNAPQPRATSHLHTGLTASHQMDKRR